jgi:hypothetical protein
VIPPAPSSKKTLAKPAPKLKAHTQAVVAPAPVAYPQRRKDGVAPIWVGESLRYQVTYFGVAAGDVTLEVLPEKFVNGRKVYHLKGLAETSSVFSMVYRLKDTIESYMDYDGHFSHRFHLILDESKQTRNALELNDSEKGQTFYWNRWNHHKRGYTETKETFPIPKFPQDSLSSLYYLRTLPLEVGKEFSFPVVSEGKNWEAIAKVLRTEMMDTPLGKKQVLVIQPETKFEGSLRKQGDSFLYLTNDDRKFLVRLEAKVRIGTVVAELKKVELGQKP